MARRELSGGYFILVGHEPKPVADVLEWGRWFETADNRQVCETEFGHEAIGVVRISTVFIGLDHRFFGDGPPVLFETLVFGGHKDGYMERCCTWSEAELQHRRVVEMVKQELQAAIREVSGA